MDSAPYVGAGAGMSDSASLSPLTIPAAEVKNTATVNRGEDVNVLLELSEQQKLTLFSYLKSRIQSGIIARNRRKRRYARIDKTISTWQKLSPEDTQREVIEDNTGKSMAIPFNLPMMASHLNDMVSYYAEAIAPISNPFFSASGEQLAKALLDKMNRDALKQDYYGQIQLSLRSLLKYNIGGLEIYWDDDRPAWQPGRTSIAVPGNCTRSLDMYNTIWDPSIRKVSELASKGEWGATIEMTNRLDIIRQSLGGKWVGLEDFIEKNFSGTARANLYIEPGIESGVGQDGEDGKTAPTGSQGVNWDNFGLGMATDLGPEVDGFEKVHMYCWVIPAHFGLLTDSERETLKGNMINPETFMELWEFTMIGDSYLVSAEPVMERDKFIGGEKVEIPMYLAYMTQDQLNEAQRSFMELMKGFQRFASNMYNIYTNGMRKNVWGLTVADETAVDVSGLKNGDPIGVITMKQAGRDVRTALSNTASNTNVDGALQSVTQTINLKDSFFPSQALPSQIAGIDRAVKSQVTTVVQGAQRSLRTLLRVLDSSLLLPVRLQLYRNLKNNEAGLESITEEIVAKLVGSGIESMESERVVDALWTLLYAIIQNQESMQTFNVPDLLTYIGRVGNLSVDLGQFARQPAQAAPTQQPAAAPVEGQPAAV